MDNTPSKVCKVFNYDNKPVVDDLASQDGTEDFIRKHTCLAASAPVGESANITLAHKTAIVKLTVQFPDDADAPSLANTKITLKQRDGSACLINKACLELAEAVTSSEPGASEFGDIVVTPTSVDAQAKTATAYALVWPTSAGFKDVTVGATIDNATFSGLFTASAIQPGQENAVTSVVDFDSREYDLWMDDAAHTITDVLGNYVDGPKWMALANGTISIEANTSGSIRKGTMTLDNGRKYDSYYTCQNLYRVTEIRFKEQILLFPQIHFFYKGLLSGFCHKGVFKIDVIPSRYNIRHFISRLLVKSF